MARHEVITPFPGIFYRRPDPDSDPYANEGDEIEEGATIGLVEIMKQFHPVETEQAGKLVEYLVGNEEEITAGQAVAVLDDGS
jgi:acetyl-CoA carboxylase biotin carboxyl carrier protein